MSLADAAGSLAIVTMAALALAAAVTDLRARRVPNVIPLAIAALYPALVLAPGSTVDWTGGLATGAIALLVGYLLFALRLCGGGDAKLFAALAIWAGPALILPFALWTAVAGGAIALVMWVQQKLTRAPSLAAARFAQVEAGFHRLAMPYALAIAAGALYLSLALFERV